MPNVRRPSLPCLLPNCRADIPLRKAVAGARVGLLPGRGYVINPTVEEQEESTLDLLIAGTSEAVLMIEGFCDFLTEEQMLEVGCEKSTCWLVPV